MNLFKNLFKRKPIFDSVRNYVVDTRTDLRQLHLKLNDLQKSSQDELNQLQAACELVKGDSEYAEFIRKKISKRVTRLNNITAEAVVDLAAQVSAQKNKLEKAVKAYVDESDRGKVPMKYLKYLKKYPSKRSRESMPQIDGDNNKQYVLDHFEKKVGITRGRKKLKQLKPSQNEINEEKVISMMGSEQHASEYIISNDGHIVDGHHTWALGLELDDAEEVDVIVIDLPIETLLKRMNQLKVSTKRDIADQELKKSYTKVGEEQKRTDLWVMLHSLTTIVKGYDNGQVSESSFQLVRDQFYIDDDKLNQLRKFNEFNSK